MTLCVRTLGTHAWKNQGKILGEKKGHLSVASGKP